MKPFRKPNLLRKPPRKPFRKPFGSQSGRPSREPFEDPLGNLSKTLSEILSKTPSGHATPKHPPFGALRSVPRVPKPLRSRPEALPNAPFEATDGTSFRNFRKPYRSPSEHARCPEDQPGGRPSKPLSE